MDGQMKDVMQFVHGVRAELSKVVWPKWDEFVGSTVVVLVLVALFAVYLFSLDSAMSWLAGYVFEQYGVA